MSILGALPNNRMNLTRSALQNGLPRPLQVIRGCVLKPWQMVTIPAATVHRTRAIGRTVNLCFEDLAAETVFVDASGVADSLTSVVLR
jgi:hypothetical protein